MKNNIFLFVFLLLGYVCELQAQVVNIPDVNLLNKLIALGADFNNDGQIQTSEASVFDGGAVGIGGGRLDISNSNISDLTGLQYFHSNNLTEFDCSGNQITNLIVPGGMYFYDLDCSNNLITSAVFSPGFFSSTTPYTFLDFSNNQLTNLVIPSSNIHYLYCQNNLLTNLDLSGSVINSELDASNNQLSTMTMNFYSTGSSTVSFLNNPLTTLFMKNGFDDTYDFSLSLPNTLQYYCVDTIDFTCGGMCPYSPPLGVVINSFCSFPPSGPYNTVMGLSYYDANMNGCSVADSTAPMMIEITNGIDTTYACNVAGPYVGFTATGNYTLTPQPQVPSYFTVSPAVANSNFANYGNTYTQDFCIVPNGVFPDVEILLVPLFCARPGHSCYYLVQYHNKGTTVAAGNIVLDFMGNNMNFGNASIAPSAQTANQLTWTYSNLQPLETRSITFAMYILPPPINNIGDILTFTDSIPFIGDLDTTDNTFILPQTVVGPYDPNDKTCLEGGLVNNSKIGDYLHYLVRFQNTGNYPADHVVIVDSIDVNQFDISSIQFVDASHPTHLTVANGVLQFYFENIMLPDSFSDEPGSHGYALYKIRTKANLPLNSTVSNTAEIYFDYNPAVVTNTAVTTFGGFTSMSVTHSNVTCFGAANGSISINSTGGTNPISYGIGGINGSFQSNPNFTGLVPGVYNVIIRDSLGFMDIVALTISEPSELIGNASALPVLCWNGMTTVDVTATGGTAPYTGIGSFSASAGSFSYIIADQHGCIDTTILTIAEPDELIGTASALPLLCSNGTTTVDVSATGGTGSYTGIGSFSGVEGVNTYIITDQNGCLDTATITLVAQDTPPTANFGNTATGGGQFTFTNASSPNTTSYFWDFGNGATDTNENPIYTYPTNGSYTVMLIASNACGSDTSYQTVLVSTVNIAHTNIEGDIRVFPNPIKDELNISTQFEKATQGKVVLYDLIGKRIIEKAFGYGMGIDMRLSLADLATGTYVLVIETDLGTYVEKIVKE